MSTDNIIPIECGDVVALKKSHPCGSNEWKVVRVGADIGLCCQGCGRKVMLVRSEFDRRYRRHIVHAKTDRAEHGKTEA